VLLRSEQRAATGKIGPLERLAGRLVPGLRQLVGPTGMRWLQRQVELAGRPDGASADTVLRWGGMWLILLSPAGLVLVLQGALLPVLMIPLVASIMPMARLSRARRLRQEALDRDLPDFLDILSVTVSAGVGFRSALLRVSERYGGPLAEEMRLTLDQIAHGATRRAAFTALRNRNRSDALAQFTTAFLQSEELGAPLADTLNQIAADMRRASAQRMRRRAAQTAPRVTLVTSMVLVPGALVLILVGMYLGSGIDFSQVFGG
jgi:tight adherence protein C